LLITILKFNRNERPTHPTQKSVDLCEWFIKSYSNEGDTILDNTMGGGTTGIAYLNTNRNFIGIEMNEKYYNITYKWLNERKAESEKIKEEQIVDEE
tara:strand:- start:566 stop:856 length:291 start_codon:yes stop_codon:yes gene_type:complete